MRRHISYSNVAATLALVFALAGSAVAAKAIVTKPSQLGKAVVTNQKVKKGTLSESRLSGKAREALKGANGAPGAPGAPGAAGAPGVSGLQVVVQGSGVMDSNSPKVATAECPAGKRAIAGGHRLIGAADGGSPNVELHVGIDGSEPTDGSAGWRVIADELEPYANPWQVLAFATCAHVA